jgi:hypothetical protein
VGHWAGRARKGFDRPAAACSRWWASRRAVSCPSRRSPLLWMADFDGSTRTFLLPSSCGQGMNSCFAPCLARAAQATATACRLERQHDKLVQKWTAGCAEGGLCM